MASTSVNAPSWMNSCQGSGGSGMRRGDAEHQRVAVEQPDRDVQRRRAGRMAMFRHQADDALRRAAAPDAIHVDLVVVAEPISQLGDECPLDRGDLMPVQRLDPDNVPARLVASRSALKRSRSAARASTIQRFEAAREPFDAMRAVADAADAHAELASIAQDESDDDCEHDADHEHERRRETPEHRGGQQAHARDRRGVHSVSTGTPIT